MLKSTKSSLCKIVSDNLQFNIPIYQRLYVWDSEVIKVFLTDLKNAFLDNRQQDYFIGSIVFVKSENGIYDLIDGQQRSTTLWLISIVLGNKLNDYAFVDGGKMRLNFSIRENVTAYFKHILEIQDETSIKDFEDEEDLVNISKAYIQIKAFMENEENDVFDKKREFSDFIYKKVRLICTEVPPTTDFTKLFEVINARGVQLRQDEILKAKLLAVINKDNVNKHKTGNLSKIWEACADMDGYVAYNLKNQLNKSITWRDLLQSDYKNIENNGGIEVKKFSQDFFKKFIVDPRYQPVLSDKPKSLISILENRHSMDASDINAEEHTQEDMTSIISFPMLLLHALRIFLKEKDAKDISIFNEKKLNAIFDTSFFKNEKLFEKQIKSSVVIDFFECLWKVKVVFDESVVKWVSTDKEKELNFVKLYFTNSKGNEYPKLDVQEYNSFTALQSMLYHSQEMITQFWLTPYLYHIVSMSKIETPDLFGYLRKLDNKLLSSMFTKGDLKERTWKLMSNFNFKAANTFNKARFELSAPNALGVKFPQYWFYKLEYVLHYEVLKNKGFLNELKNISPYMTKYKKIAHLELWRQYRITAKNSVEHISPQNPSIAKDKLCKTTLHHFGNLALVTRSVNSSYSNNSFNVKRVKFQDSLKNNRIDALKLFLIYDNWDEHLWNDIAASRHQEDMTVVLENYFINNI